MGATLPTLEESSMEFRLRNVFVLCLSAVALLAPAALADQSLEVKGPITDLRGSAPTQTFKVNGISFTTNATTQVSNLAGGLANGALVKVKSLSTSSPFVATRVKGRSADSDHGGQQVPKASVEGLITGLTGTSPNFSFTVGTRRVVTNGTTTGLTLIAPNANIEAKGPVDAQGTITATKIESEDD
jgi:hypothetical protein